MQINEAPQETTSFVIAQRSPQRALTEEDHLGQALLLDQPHPALCLV